VAAARERELCAEPRAGSTFARQQREPESVADDLEDLTALLPPLLQGLDALAFVSRYLNPPDLPAVLAAAGDPDAKVGEALPRLAAWPDNLKGLAARLTSASEAMMSAFEGLRAAAETPLEVRGAYRALRYVSRAQEALWPLASGLPPVSRYFSDEAARKDPGLQQRLMRPSEREDVGLFHIENDTGQRGGFSLYVPESYSDDRDWPLVVALHGGAGHGRAFLWTWLPAARSRGAILISPTAVGETWSLSGPDRDTPNLTEIVARIEARWRIDPKKRLLTGMSDGGTFSYVSGLEPTSIFTHLAPVSAAFHPMLAQMADPARLSGLPIHIVHGALDWMFPIEMARQAQAALSGAGADVTYVEVEDLSHTYPRELNPQILAWLGDH